MPDSMSPTPAEQAIAHDVRHAESVGAAYVQVRTQNLRAVLSSLAEARRERDEMRETAQAAITEVRGIGQRYRNDWSDFDGRQLRSELNEATETLLSRIAAGTPTEDRENG